jgi:phosphatidylserine decarboxylase
MNSGQANKLTIRLIIQSVVALGCLFLIAWAGRELGDLILRFYYFFVAIWAVFLVAVIYWSRDPDPLEPGELSAIVSPAHGTVDVIEDTVESQFMNGPCKRISIRVALTDVQVQYAPLTATVAQFTYQHPSKDGGTIAKENLFLGLDVIGRPETRAAVRLVGGTWGTRILPWVKSNDIVSRSVRIAMMRPASRVDLYLPSHVKLLVNLGDEVGGGQTVVAKFE